mmetsp:Transcript_96936/g.274156  ORF Transcript_96936/g.274156 Transcript_96936/m.274156 type:complete len:223 (-) Transcript_96936:395-1063(-)
MASPTLQAAVRQLWGGPLRPRGIRTPRGGSTSPVCHCSISPSSRRGQPCSRRAGSLYSPAALWSSAHNLSQRAYNTTSVCPQTSRSPSSNNQHGSRMAMSLHQTWWCCCCPQLRPQLAFWRVLASLLRQRLPGPPTPAFPTSQGHSPPRSQGPRSRSTIPFWPTTSSRWVPLQLHPCGGSESLPWECRLRLQTLSIWPVPPQQPQPAHAKLVTRTRHGQMLH